MKMVTIEGTKNPRKEIKEDGERGVENKEKEENEKITDEGVHQGVVPYSQGAGSGGVVHKNPPGD